MEDDYDTLEDKPAGTNWMLTALALLAFLLGGAALFFALDASRRLSPMSDSLSEGVSGMAGFGKKIEEMGGGGGGIGEGGGVLNARLQRGSAFANQKEKID